MREEIYDQYVSKYPFVLHNFSGEKKGKIHEKQTCPFHFSAWEIIHPSNT